MSSKYQKAFMQFLSEAKELADATSAEFELSDEILNSVLVSGEIVGQDTKEKLEKISKKNGLLFIANDLTILYRT